MSHGDIHNLVYDLHQKALEDVLRQLLKQYLNREPVPADAKIITIGTNPNWDYYLVAIEGVHVGKISWDYSNPSKVTVTFKPKT